MSYGVINGFAEKLNGIEYIGTGAKIQSVTMDNKVGRIQNIVGDGLVIDHFINGTSGKYFFINLKDVRELAEKERYHDIEQIPEYVIFALITDDGEHISSIKDIEKTRKIIEKALKNMKLSKKILWVVAVALILPFFFMPALGLIIVIPFLLFALPAIIVGLISIKIAKNKDNKTKKYMSIQYDRMEKEKLEKYLIENKFNLKTTEEELAD